MVVSLGLYRGSGGPSKTIAAFKEALDAELYMFCKATDLLNEQTVVRDARCVPSSKWPLLSQFVWPEKKDKVKAEEAASVAGLVSCHSYYRYHALWVEAMHRRHGTPYWFVPHGILDPWVTKKNFLQKKLFSNLGGKRFLERAKTVIFSTPAEREKALSQFRFQNTDIVPWPVELVDCSLRESLRSKIRRELSIPDGASVLLYFGRLHSMKRPLETIRAVARSSSKLHLLIIGNEQDVSLEECQRVVREHQMAGRVHLLGPVYGERKYEYMHAADAYISMSHRENFNHTAAESLAAGLPLILSPGNDLISSIKGIDCFWEIESSDTESAIKAIAAFENCSQEERRMKGQIGRDWVASELNFDLFQARLVQLAKKYGRT